MISVQKRIDKYIDSLFNEVHNLSLIDAIKLAKELEEKRYKLHEKNREHVIKAKKSYIVKNTGNHIPYNGKKRTIKQILKIINKTIINKNPKLITYLCEHVNTFTINERKDKKVKRYYGGELWEAIYNYEYYPKKLVDAIEDSIGTSLHLARETFSTGNISQYSVKNIVYKFFTTGDLVGYVRKKKLLMSCIQSDFFNKEELNDMLMYSKNYRCIMCDINESTLCTVKYDKNINILKKILTMDNFNEAINDLNSIEK